MKDSAKHLRIGPAGNSVTFYNAGFKHTYEAPAFLSGLGLNAFEYSFGRGVRITAPTAEKIAGEMAKYGIEISVHAPYYTNFCNPDPEMIEKSIGYIVDSILAVKLLGGRRVVFHPGSQGKLPREEAFGLLKQNVAFLMAELKKRLSFDDYILCPETLGKMRQMGTVEEIIELCALDEHLYPCFDFGHINSYTKGGLKNKADYLHIVELCEVGLGAEKTANMHIHFSKIQYGDQGEIRHLTFEDEKYGPEYAPLAEVIDDKKLTPFVICESKDVMSDDAVTMKNCHKTNSRAVIDKN